MYCSTVLKCTILRIRSVRRSKSTAPIHYATMVVNHAFAHSRAQTGRMDPPSRVLSLIDYTESSRSNHVTLIITLVLR